MDKIYRFGRISLPLLFVSSLVFLAFYSKDKDGVTENTWRSIFNPSDSTPGYSRYVTNPDGAEVIDRETGEVIQTLQCGERVFIYNNEPSEHEDMIADVANQTDEDWKLTDERGPNGPTLINREHIGTVAFCTQL